MKKRLFFSNSVNVDATDFCIESLLPVIPFCGIKGTICRVEVLKDDDGRELCYYKVLYNHDGTIANDKIRVPKCRGKNLESLLNDYYSDLKKYLDLNSSKYLNYKNDRMKEIVDKKKVQMGLVISAILSVVFIPVLVSTTYIGAIIEAVSLFLLYMTNDLRKKVVQDEKKYEFIKEYDTYQKDLVNHYIIKDNKNSKVDRTIYTEISSKNQSLERKLPKIKSKILIKDDIKEVA